MCVCDACVCACVRECVREQMFLVKTVCVFEKLPLVSTSRVLRLSRCVRLCSLFWGRCTLGMLESGGISGNDDGMFPERESLPHTC